MRASGSWRRIAPGAARVTTEAVTSGQKFSFIDASLHLVSLLRLPRGNFIRPAE